MVNVSTYNVYVEPGATIDDPPLLIGDAIGNTITVNQAGPAVIAITPVGGLTFASPPFTWAGTSRPKWLGWGPIDPAAPAAGIAVNDANAAAGMATLELQLLIGGETPLAAFPISIVNSTF
jgi:hypothetical protein